MRYSGQEIGDRRTDIMISEVLIFHNWCVNYFEETKILIAETPIKCQNHLNLIHYSYLTQSLIGAITWQSNTLLLRQKGMPQIILLTSDTVLCWLAKCMTTRCWFYILLFGQQCTSLRQVDNNAAAE
jgi:hypothetical protein